MSILKIRRLCLAASLALFAGLSLFAQASPSLEYVAEQLSKNKVTRGQFVLKRTAANGKSLKSSGDFAIASDYGIIWKTIKPIKTIQVVAKEFTLTESAGGKRIKTDAGKNPVYRQMALLTSSLWNGDLAAAQEAADIKFSSDKNNWQIEMFPKDQAVQMALEKIVVEGKAEGGQAWATKMRMLLKGGNEACYNMSGHSFAASLSESEQAYFD
ncbi:MAG: hypothetical protein IK094_08885 [Treponema sp.]|nr:hypothetical protein [Treponema sp.]